MARTVPLWRRLFGPDPKADVRDELQFHLEAKIDDLIARGLSPEEAKQQAVREFGDLQSVQKIGELMSEQRETRRQRKDYWGGWAQDWRYALRTLRKEPAFAIILVLILALGIAANTTVFSVVNTVLLRPLPFPESQQLVWLSSTKRRPPLGAELGLSAVTYTVDAFEEFQRHNSSFQSITSYNPFFGNSEYTLTGSGEPQAVAGVMVARDFFQTLGVRPVIGRFFTAEECQKGGRSAMLLGYGFWQRQFAGDPAIVGRTVTLSNHPVTVVGVLPPSFDFGSVFSPGTRFDVFVPAIMDELRNWGNTLALVGRLKPGVSLNQAQAEADVLFPQFRKAHPEWFGSYESTLTELRDFVSGKLRRALIMLWCAVGLILLIVCVNLSNLLLARAAARSKEFALRTALGAGRMRLFQQLLTESVVLVAAGTLLGLGLAFALTLYLAHQGSIALPLLNSVTIDGAALGWTMWSTAAVALVFGLVPGLKLSTGNLQEALKDSGAGMSSGRKHERLRSMLVVSEVALACVLLIGAGLLLRSFLNVLDIDLGFRPSQAAVIKIDYNDGGKAERRGAILAEIIRNVNAIPGVETSGVADMLPLGRNRSWGFMAKGRLYRKGERRAAIVRIVTPGYLSAMGIHLNAGRDFSWADGPNAEHVVIINQAAARSHWPGEDPLARLAQVNGDTRVIGIVDDVRVTNLEASAGPEMYLPMTQADPEGAELVVRTKLPPEALAPAVMKTLRALNPAQPASEFLPLRHIVDHAVSPRRFFVLLVTGFAVFGLVLACLGIYGVMSYSVTRQTQEIGIRMALGATAKQVQARVILNALRLALFGAAFGAVGSLLAARSIASLLFGTRPTDPVTFMAIVLLLTAVSLLAGYIPARRASHIEPMSALRTS